MFRYCGGFFAGAAFIVTAAAASLQIPEPHTATFHAGTRLVEVEVVVRGKQGPVTGLKKEDFTVLDQGRPQRIDVFHAGPADAATHAMPLPRGAVSNRVDNLGEALPSGTVLLFDQLNTRLDFKAYERKAVLQLAHSLGPRDRVAIYSLGRNLRVLQDFTDDPHKLLAAVTNPDAGRDLLPANTEDNIYDVPSDASGRLTEGKGAGSGMYVQGNLRLAETTAQVNASNNGQTTIQALTRIVSHLSGISGRRNLVWIEEQPVVPPPVMGMLLQANIALYPVLTRTVLYSGPDFMPIAKGGWVSAERFPVEFMATQHAAQALASATGGASFNDAADLLTAVKTAQEDSRSSYTLGYYPSEDVLDGKYHPLAVKVTGEKSAKLEVRYRPGYIASKEALSKPVPPQAAALAELFADPLDATAIGLTARTRPDPAKPGAHEVLVTVDLHDVHLERKGDRSTGDIEIAVPLRNDVRLRTIHLDLTDDQLASSLVQGFSTVLSGVEVSGPSIRIVARDPSTGLAGSLNLPLK